MVYVYTTSWQEFTEGPIAFTSNLQLHPLLIRERHLMHIQFHCQGTALALHRYALFLIATTTQTICRRERITVRVILHS